MSTSGGGVGRAAVLDRADEVALHAYFDGELRGLARWRFERRLRRSAALRRELETLALAGQLVRETEPPIETPDLWAALARELPAADAARRAERDGAAAAPGGWLAPLLRPLPAAVAAAAVALAVAGSYLLGGESPPPSIVHFVDSGGRSVWVQDDADMTVIWVFEAATEGAHRGGSVGAA